MDDAASSCDSQHGGNLGACDDDCTSAASHGQAIGEQNLHPALLELIELSLQRCAPGTLSVSIHGPSAPPRVVVGGGGGALGCKRASGDGGSCGGAAGDGRNQKRRWPVSPAAAVERAAAHDDDASAAAAEHTSNMDCSLASADSAAAAGALGAARAADADAAPRRGALRQLRLDLDALEPLLSPAAAGGGGTPATPAEWLDLVEEHLSGRGRGGPGSGAPRQRPAAPGLVYMGLTSGGART